MSAGVEVTLPLWQAVLTGAGGVFLLIAGWLWGRINVADKNIRSLDERVSVIAIDHARLYVPRTEMRANISDAIRPLAESLARIEVSLSTKADKRP